MTEKFRKVFGVTRLPESLTDPASDSLISTYKAYLETTRARIETESQAMRSCEVSAAAIGCRISAPWDADRDTSSLPRALVALMFTKSKVEFLHQ